MVTKFVIIAGTEKSGTTSVFQYLGDSGLFNVSKRKETDYFRNGNAVCSKYEYLSEFSESKNDGIFLEASPGYLADSYVVSNKIQQTLPNEALLVFMLRSPLGRLKSSFLFHKSRLYIPKDMSFNSYIELCRSYEQGVSARDLNLEEWFLRVPDAGKYYSHLVDFDGIPIKVFEFNEFSENPGDCVTSILSDIGITTRFFDTYHFDVSNKTNMYKYENLQRISLFLNKKLEFFFFKFPIIKRSLLSIYSLINGASKEDISISSENLNWLRDFYSDDIQKLCEDGYISSEAKRRWMNDLT